jgi:anti-anti-sigma factor
MKIAVENTSGLLVIHTEGRLDAITSIEFEKDVLPLIQQSGKPVLVDFGKLDYISSAGLRTLIFLTKEMKKNNNLLAICCLSQAVMEVFSISGIDAIISIYPTIEEGITALK